MSSSATPYYVRYFPPSYVRTLTFWNFFALYSILLRWCPGYRRLHFSHLQARPYVRNPLDLVRNQLSCISVFKQVHVLSSVSLLSCRALSARSSRPGEKTGELHFNTSSWRPRTERLVKEVIILDGYWTLEVLFPQILFKIVSIFCLTLIISMASEFQNIPKPLDKVWLTR